MSNKPFTKKQNPAQRIKDLIKKLEEAKTIKKASDLIRKTTQEFKEISKSFRKIR